MHILTQFGEAPDILPTWLTEFNLLQGFIWYISITFALSLILRVRFYRSIFKLARHVSSSCPNVFRLLNDHWFVCIKDGLVLLVGIYSGILLAYWVLSRVVWPEANVSIAHLAQWGAGIMTLNLAFIGVMFAVDLALIAQVSVVDEEEVMEDLAFSERWLGSRVNQLLSYLGKWNPIKTYADSKAHETMVWVNDIFRSSVAIMIAQLIIRLSVGTSLFATYVVLG